MHFVHCSLFALYEYCPSDFWTVKLLKRFSAGNTWDKLCSWHMCTTLHPPPPLVCPPSATSWSWFLPLRCHSGAAGRRRTQLSSQRRDGGWWMDVTKRNRRNPPEVNIWQSLCTWTVHRCRYRVDREGYMCFYTCYLIYIFIYTVYINIYVYKHTHIHMCLCVCMYTVYIKNENMKLRTILQSWGHI